MNQDILTEIDDCKRKLDESDSPLEPIIKLRKLTSKEVNPPLEEIISSNVCAKLVAIMDNTTSSEIIMESLWILTNVCSGSTVQTQYIINIGGITSFLKFVSHENEEVMAQALWGLGNIAGDSSVNRDIVLKEGAVQIVLQQLERKSLKIANQRTIVWVISNFCRGKPHPKYSIVRPCIFYLGKALETYLTDEEIISDSLWGINYLSETDEAIEDLINYGILQKICKFLASHSNRVLTPAVRIIGNVATSKDTYVDFLLAQNVLPPLISLFKHDKKGYRKESLWTVSNIMAGTEAQVSKVLHQPQFFDNLISNRNQQLDVKKEMYFVISNSLNMPSACNFFLKHKVLSYFFEDILVTDQKMQAVIVEGLELLIKHILKKKKVCPELNGKAQYLKEKVKPQINNTLTTRLKSIQNMLALYEKKHPSVDALTSGIEGLKIDQEKPEGEKNGEEESDSSYETVDEDEESENQEDEDEEDEEEEEEDFEDEDEDKIDIEENGKKNNNKQIISNLFSSAQQIGKGANAQHAPLLELNSEIDPELLVVNDENLAAAGAAAPPIPMIDYQEFYFTDEQQQQLAGQSGAGAAAAPGP